MTSSRTLEIDASLPRSSFMIDGGLARVNPVPTTFQPPLWKDLTTCLPSRPVAPVTSAVFAIVVVFEVEVDGHRGNEGEDQSSTMT